LIRFCQVSDTGPLGLLFKLKLMNIFLLLFQVEDEGGGRLVLNNHQAVKTKGLRNDSLMTTLVCLFLYNNRTKLSFSNKYIFLIKRTNYKKQ